MKRKCKSRALALLICAIMVPAAFSCSQKEEPQSGAEESKTEINTPDVGSGTETTEWPVPDYSDFVMPEETGELVVYVMDDTWDESKAPRRLPDAALSLFREVVSHVGIEKLLWGSDVPGTLNRATYPQMINMWKRAGLSEADLSKLLGENALSVYDLPVKAQEKK